MYYAVSLNEMSPEMLMPPALIPTSSDTSAALTAAGKQHVTSSATSAALTGAGKQHVTSSDTSAALTGAGKQHVTSSATSSTLETARKQQNASIYSDLLRHGREFAAN